MVAEYLDFEQSIAELEAKIEELRKLGSDSEINITEEVAKLKEKSQLQTEQVFKNLTDWQIIRLARHPMRPHAKDYIDTVFDEFDELHGDRAFATDYALVAGIAKLGEQSVMVLGQQKGRETKEKIHRNFGMMHPEGYRRAKRLMELANKFNLPIITLIDTPGAYPGIEAEARGQSEAIARNLFVMSGLSVPIISVIIGEGCSGGALGLGVADEVLMLQYSYYATISPEGCASILFKSAEKAPEAANIMGITANKLLEQGIIDSIIEEPLGGAHRDPDAMSQTLQATLIATLKRLSKVDEATRVNARFERFAQLGTFIEEKS